MEVLAGPDDGEVTRLGCGAIRPTESPPKFVNQTAPSGPSVMPSGSFTVEAEYKEIFPRIDTRPTETFGESLPKFVNHNALLDAAIARGSSNPGLEKLATSPSMVMRPIELLYAFVNHIAPSGPRAIP
jgi:hypothetical protein